MMKKVTVFGSRYWPQCEPVKEFLSANNIDFDYFDISENLMNLKMYLRCRDFRPEFDKVKEQGKIGIPLIVVGDGEKFIIEREPTLDELK